MQHLAREVLAPRAGQEEDRFGHVVGLRTPIPTRGVLVAFTRYGDGTVGLVEEWSDRTRHA